MKNFVDAQLSCFSEIPSTALKAQRKLARCWCASTYAGNLSLTAGDNDGELDAQWDPVRGAKSYEIQISPDPITTTGWVSSPTVTKSKAVLKGLISGQRMNVRVRAVGTAGQGAWSDPAVKIAP